MLTVRFNDATCIDVASGNIQDKPSKALLFSSPVVFKRIKPSTRYKKKVAALWISATKLSFEYVMAFYMVREEKKRIAGFYHIGDDKYLVVEFEIVASPPGLKSTWSLQKETPHDYLAIEDKTFDAVFGNTQASDTTIDFDKLYKEVVGGMSPAMQITAGACALLLCAAAYFYLFADTPKPQLAASPAQQDTQPPPLTDAETRDLQAAVFYELVDSFNKLVADLGNDKVFSAVQVSITNNANSVSGKLNVRYRSFYPFATSMKDGDHYSWENNINIEKGRKDLRGGALFKDSIACLGTMLKDKWDVTQREDKVWHMKLALPAYRDFIKAVNSVVACPVAVKSIKLNEGDFVCELDLRV